MLRDCDIWLKAVETASGPLCGGLKKPGNILRLLSMVGLYLVEFHISI